MMRASFHCWPMNWRPSNLAPSKRGSPTSHGCRRGPPDNWAAGAARPVARELPAAYETRGADARSLKARAGQ
eukprot:728165-Pyramimonas_sp.AAC.2